MFPGDKAFEFVTSTGRQNLVWGGRVVVRDRVLNGDFNADDAGPPNAP